MEFANEEEFTAGTGSQLRACEECARKLSGQIIISPTDEEFRLVIEHDDFAAVENRTADVVRTMHCQHCYGPIGKNPDENFEFARRMLRLTPDLITDPETTARWTCDNCADDCPDCDHE